MHIKRKYQYYLLPLLVIFCLSLNIRSSSAYDFDDMHANTAHKNKVLSAYLVGFIKFIDFPKEQKIYNYCIGASQELADLITAASYHLVFDRVINAYTVTPESDLTKCQILYVSSERLPQYPDIDSLKNVVTVSDSYDFIKKNGGMIQVNEASGRFVFVLDIVKIEKSSFKVSSKLVELAEKVY